MRLLIVPPLLHIPAVVCDVSGVTPRKNNSLSPARCITSLNTFRQAEMHIMTNQR